MRKCRIAGIAFLTALALTACGGSEKPAETTAAATTAAETTAEESKAEETTAEESKEETAAETTEAAEAESGSGEAADGEEITIRLGVPKAPPTLAVLRMMDTNALGENVKFELDIWDAPEQLLAMVQDGDHQMFAFPLTVVAKLSNKGVPVRLTNVNTWGVTYFVTTDPDLTEWSQLKGKTVYVPLQSSPPDALTQYFLSAAGLTVGEDVEIIYSTTSEISQMLAGGQIEYATLIEPQVTAAQMKNDKVRVAFAFEDEWKKIKGDDSIIPNAGFGTLAPFAEEHPELIKQFEAAYEEALNWVLENPAEAGALAEEQLGLKAALVEKAIPKMGLLYKSAQDAKPELDGFYQLLNDFDASMIGGKIPDDSMYYAE